MSSCLPTPVRSSRSSRASRAARGARALLAVLALGAPLAAHDHWIEPTTFRPAVGERVELALCVGRPAQFEQQVRDPRHFTRFESWAPGATAAQPVLGLDGKSPAGLFKAKVAGAHLIVFQSDHSSVEIEPAKYTAFLREEGLEDVLAERERRGESALPGRDSYVRFDKTLLDVANGPVANKPADGVDRVGFDRDGFDRDVGLPFELVLETDPSAWQPEQPIHLRLELAGQPIAGRQIRLTRLTEPHLVLLARTDAAGRAEFVPPSAGPFCACSVYQRRATKEQGLDGDWEGLWASFSFELGSAASATTH